MGNYYFDANGDKKGPFTKATLLNLAGTGKITENTVFEINGQRVKGKAIKNLQPIFEKRTTDKATTFSAPPEESTVISPPPSQDTYDISSAFNSDFGNEENSKNDMNDEPEPAFGFDFTKHIGPPMGAGFLNNSTTTPVTPSEPAHSEDSDEVFCCTNCGNPIASQAVVCMKCGADPQAHRNFCRYCGEQLNPKQVVCIRCGTSIGVKQKERESNNGFNTEGKNQTVAAILAFLLGGCGVHRFYLGDKVAAIYYLLLSFLGIFLLYAYANLYTIANYGRIDDFGDLGPGYLFFFVAWGMPIIDGFRILSLTPDEFAQKYNE